MNSFTPPNSLPYYIFLLLLALASLVILLLLLRKRVARPEPVCAKCDYMVRGLPGTICPECGADLSLPGSVLPAGTYRPLDRSLHFVLFFFVAAPLILIATPAVLDYIPAWRSRGEMFELHPASKKFVKVEIFHSGDGIFPPIGIIKIVLDPPSRITAVMEIDPATMQAHYPGKNWQPTVVKFSPDVLLKMMQTTGIDPNDPSAVKDANSISQIVDEIAKGKGSATGAGWAQQTIGRWDQSTRPRWYLFATYAAFALIGFAIFTIWRRRVERPRSAMTIAAASASP